LQIQQLKIKIQKLKPKKQRKIKANPNSKFITIKTIKKAQIEAEIIKILNNNNNISKKIESIENFIEIKK